MRRAASTVTVVTTAGRAGRLGLTVSAMSSLSADPPSLLVCINRQSPAAAAIEGNGVFCVNLLDESQHEISETFAGRRAQAREDHLASHAWTIRATGSPVLHEAAAAFDCRVGASHGFGSHLVVMGLVVDIACGARRPLVYHDRAYCALAAQSTARDLDEAGAALGALGWGF